MRNLTAVIVLFIFFLISPIDSFAQFKEKGPKGDALRYNSWLQKKNSHKGYRLNRGQRNSLGLSNGFLGTGIGANKSRNKKKKQPHTAKKEQL